MAPSKVKKTALIERDAEPVLVSPHDTAQAQSMAGITDVNPSGGYRLVRYLYRRSGPGEPTWLKLSEFKNLICGIYATQSKLARTTVALSRLRACPRPRVRATHLEAGNEVEVAR